AAEDERTAQTGVWISIGFWVLFDFLTTATGLYAHACSLTLADRAAAFPALAIGFLPPVVQGLFYLGLLATVMSTVDGYTFIGGGDFGRGLLWRWGGGPGRGGAEPDDARVIGYTQIGFLITAALAVVMALFFRSAVDLWHDVGSVGVP